MPAEDVQFSDTHGTMKTFLQNWKKRERKHVDHLSAKKQLSRLLILQLLLVALQYMGFLRLLKKKVWEKSPDLLSQGWEEKIIDRFENVFSAWKKKHMCYKSTIVVTIIVYDNSWLVFNINFTVNQTLKVLFVFNKFLKVAGVADFGLKFCL